MHQPTIQHLGRTLPVEGPYSNTSTTQVPDSPDLAGPEFLAANYADVEATARALETLGVDTVISGITPHGPGEEGQLNLIAAAEKSSVTKRFLPSDFGPYMPDDK